MRGDPAGRSGNRWFVLNGLVLSRVKFFVLPDRKHVAYLRWNERGRKNEDRKGGPLFEHRGGSVERRDSLPASNERKR